MSKYAPTAHPTITIIRNARHTTGRRLFAHIRLAKPAFVCCVDAGDVAADAGGLISALGDASIRSFFEAGDDALAL